MAFRWKSNGSETGVGTQDIPVIRPQIKEEHSPLEAVPGFGEIKPAAMYYAQGGAVFSAAIRLLDEAYKLSRQAVDAEASGDSISAQDAILHIKALLPELFCCRSLGEGFALVVHAIMCGLDNLDTDPVSYDQMRSLRWVFRMLQAQPFLSYEKSLDLAESLEDNGFNTDPPTLNHFHELLDDE